MRKFASFILGSTIGMVVGSALALLLAPSSGKALQNQIGDSVNRLSSEVQLAANERRKELESDLNRLRQDKYKLE